MSSGFQFAGVAGAIYRMAYIKAATISFHDNAPLADTIEDSAEGFVKAQFADGDQITVFGSSNDGQYDIDGAVVAGVITLDAGDILDGEGAGALVTIFKTTTPIDEADQIGGLHNFVVTENAEKIETTAFGMGSLTDTTIASVNANPDYFTDSLNRFIEKQFIKGEVITVSGYTGGDAGNNGDKTITVVTANKITLSLSDSLTTVNAGPTITIRKKVPILWETSMPGKYSWTVTAEQMWNDSNINILDIVGTPLLFRFYDEDYYYHGIGYISSPGTVSDINDLVRENVTITGTGILLRVAIT